MNDFRPYVPRHLVAAGPHVPLQGAGTIYRAGTLVDEDDDGPPPGGPKVLQLAARRR